MNKRLLTLLNGRPELLKYVKQSRNMERKKMAWNLIVNQKKYANMDLDWYKSKDAYAILRKVLMKLVNEQLGGVGIFSCFGSNCDKELADTQKFMADEILRDPEAKKQITKNHIARLIDSLNKYPNPRLENNRTLMNILDDHRTAIELSRRLPSVPTTDAELQMRFKKFKETPSYR